MTFNSDQQNSIILFYLGLAPDQQGRKINEIWQWDYPKLEYTHDYIQWLFPLKEKTPKSPIVPVCLPL